MLNYPNMKKAYVFPGQGSQFTGMAKDLYESNTTARKMLDDANNILGFNITDIMFNGTAEDLKQTKVTQPAVFLHSVVSAICHLESKGENARPDMVAGHSLGEFSALVAAGALSFDDGLRLVSLRAMAMQKACEITPGTMAAIIGLSAETIENICKEVSRQLSSKDTTPKGESKVVVAANYNCDGQIVISGDVDAVALACEKLSTAGARRALRLQVGGAFHSPLMEAAREELAKAIEATDVKTPLCPIYQNVTALPSTDPATIKANLLTQLTSPVKWTQTVKNMIADTGEAEIAFSEFGPGTVLQGLIKKINPNVSIVLH